MTLTEFNDEFELLYNNITSNQAPGLDLYEKSVFLTKGQDDVLKAYFNLKGNKYFEGFDDSSERQIDFSNLITTIECELQPTATNPLLKVQSQGKVYKFPTDCLQIVNEILQVEGPVPELQILPISYSEYTRLMTKPYGQPLKRQAWRLLSGKNDSNKTATIIAHSYDTQYKYYVIRYIRKPKPIILEPLSNVSIGGYVGCDAQGNLVTSGAVKGSECELDTILHKEILQRAVELAKASYNDTSNTVLGSVVSVGNSSATNLGAPINSKE